MDFETTREIKSYLNDEGKPYQIDVRLADPQEFIVQLWANVTGGRAEGPPTKEDASREWTHRMMCFRTTINSVGECCIRTHGHSSEFDREPLPEKVLDFIEGYQSWAPIGREER